jgi:flagellar basal-body rod protein FlgB
MAFWHDYCTQSPCVHRRARGLVLRCAYCAFVHATHDVSDMCSVRREACAFIWDRQMAETSIVELIEAGLRAEALRQKTIANNVANLQTPGYRRLDVRFEQLLAKAIGSGGQFDLEEIEPEVYQPKNTSVNPNGNDVNIEVEVCELAKNNLRQKAFIRLLNKKYSQIDEAINIR